MHNHDHKDPFDQGLHHDLAVLNQLSDRRRVLRWIAAAGLAPMFGCGGSSIDASSSGDETDAGAAGTAVTAGTAGSSGGAYAGAASTDTSCTTIPEETAGPYPADGSNGPQILTTSGIVRDDITTSFGSFSGTAAGIPLKITLKIVNASGCANLSGYAVYLWHCDRDGHYSLYTATDENYLRGVQETDSDGTVTFTSIYPACYSGRWPHIHYEVYKSLEEATAGGSAIVTTSQLAMPKAQCDEVFATTGYEASITNLSQITLATDMVFSDGATTETPTVTGNTNDGYTATLTVGVKA